MQAQAQAANRPNGVVVALILGLISLFGLVFPLLIGAAIAGIVLAIRGLRHPEPGTFRGRPGALVALVLNVLGLLASLVIPGVIAGALIFSLFHGGRLPWEVGPSPTPGPPSLPQTG